MSRSRIPRCDQTIEFGGDFAGRRWGRANDKIGLAFVTNAIKRDHQEYLKLGGLGFHAGRWEAELCARGHSGGVLHLHAWRGVYYALDAQYVDASGLQPGPRAGAGGVGADARGFLKTQVPVSPPLLIVPQVSLIP